MPRTLLTPVTPVGPYPTSFAANSLDIAWANSDTANGNYFVSSGRDLLLVRNGDAAPQTITIASKIDPYGRTGDITAYSLGIGETMAFWFGNIQGWDQGSGQIYINTSDNDMAIAVFRIPA